MNKESLVAALVGLRSSVLTQRLMRACGVLPFGFESNLEATQFCREMVAFDGHCFRKELQKRGQRS
jgi:hypothetical protein